ncbi:hypothetical protein [Chamaesiphon sp.]|uniref:hypothetical protein n=1 Tax=Chamaesiphon sp. TaxID=2814140 RepID=UPI003593AA59
MNKPVGGRGHKAAYQTTVIRIPINLKPQIDELVNRFHQGSLEIEIDKDIESKVPDLKAIIERYKVNSKPSRDWTKFNQLIGELERELALEAEPLA